MREKETFWYPCPDCGEKDVESTAGHSFNIIPGIL